jgi:hypothetical protein
MRGEEALAGAVSRAWHRQKIMDIRRSAVFPRKYAGEHI